MRWRTTILTASDRGSREDIELTSALVIRELVEEELHGEIVDERIVPEETDEIRAALIEMSEYYQAHLILTLGGVGLTTKDVTPEATRLVANREVPGFAEVIRSSLRAAGLPSAHFCGTAGIRNQTLIVNLPGSPQSVSRAMLALIPDLELSLFNIQGREL
jgi:molybdopterin adenylyltransferase